MGGNKHEQKFHQMLQALAAACHHPLDEFTISLYDRALSPHGYELVNRGLWEIFTSRRGGDRFPSIGDIREKMGLETPSRALAVDCANLILATFAQWKMEFTNREDFEEQYREKVGDLPWEVVCRMGGYRTLYREWNECQDLTVLRAQIRDSAQAVIDIARAGRAQNQLNGSAPAQIERKK